MEKHAVPAKMALLQSINIWLGDLEASIYCMNDKTGGINIYEGGGVGTMGMDGEAITASGMINNAGTWYNQFGKDKLKATLKDV